MRGGTTLVLAARFQALRQTSLPFPKFVYRFLTASALFRSRARKQAVKTLQRHYSSEHERSLPDHGLFGHSPPFLAASYREWQITRQSPRRPHYSHRNTFAESAVQTANTTTSAARSPMCADHASPFKIPLRSDTA